MSARLKGWLVLTLLLGAAIYALAEDITLTTYYPSPKGVYQELKTAGDLVVGDITNPPAARLHVVQEGAAPALRVDDELGDTSPVLIDAAGNVGIGTATPTEKLSIAALNPSVAFQDTDPGGQTWWLRSNNDVNFGFGRGAVLEANRVLTMTDAGNVGIGTTTPSQKLHVDGNILSSGTITASDARFKANVAPIPDVLAKLEQVHGVTFSWNELARTVSQQPGKTDIGVLGQELQAVFPELVVPVGKENYLTVDYARLSAVLLEGIKALMHQQQELEERIAHLEAENARK